MIKEDTIVGVSTSVGQSGISIIRLSGPDCFDIADKIFRGKDTIKNQPSHSVRYGKIISPENGDIIDEFLLIKMAAQRTYTREDVVEINCHGGYTIVRRILDLTCKYGARPSEPGEFTKRAFLNGRIDLTQAEAVMDVIQARTERVSKVAVKQLEGTLSKKINSIREKLVLLLSHIEVNLDYPEYDVEEVSLSEAHTVTSSIVSDLNCLIESFRFGKVLREGMEVVILGRPNVGKSSLMNRLARKNKSIVTDIPGTTRDIVEEYINIKGIPIKLMDTAGIHDTFDVVEKIGVERSLNALKEADYIVVLVDASESINIEDSIILEKVSQYNKPYVLVYNKVDLIDKKKLDLINKSNPGALFISVFDDKGIDELEEKIISFVSKNNQDIDNQILVTNTRHELQLKKAKEALDSVIDAIINGFTLDMVAMDLKSSIEELGKITGHMADEDVVNAIFSRFCLGK